MHFIPNPSNTEFIYLLGLEHVVDFITNGEMIEASVPKEPYKCSQCDSNFTPVWKLEKPSRSMFFFFLNFEILLCLNNNLFISIQFQIKNPKSYVNYASLAMLRNPLKQNTLID